MADSVIKKNTNTNITYNVLSDGRYSIQINDKNNNLGLRFVIFTDNQVRMDLIQNDTSLKSVYLA